MRLLQLGNEASQASAALESPAPNRAQAMQEQPAPFETAGVRRSTGASDMPLQADGPMFQALLDPLSPATPENPERLSSEVQGEAAQTEAPTLPDAEQWLRGMLDQQVASVVVSEGRAGSPLSNEWREVANADAQGGSEVLADQPLSRQSHMPAAALPGAELSPSVGAAAAGFVAAGQTGVSASLSGGDDQSSPPGLSAARQSSPAAATLLAATAALLAAPGVQSMELPQAVDGTAALPEQRLKLQAPEARWGEQMMQALRDNVELQLRSGSQQATIRLDPAELGSLEIHLSHESGRLHVQINATQGDVARLLQQTSERLRHELVGQNLMQVSVQVSSDSQQGRRQSQRPWSSLHADPVLAAAEDDSGRDRRDAAERDVLVTV